ncbi:hypothetical protein L1049_018859 [Liquidambar formosana]|uniref:Potassium channel n=1 Tax=Liquidambar formosana TaxID=63359 RepID=A0AAP0WPA8_LIQFO
MKPEYFPPKEDVILQNEAPTDLYVLVTGALIVGEAKTGDVCGEVDLLCYRPQFFTVQTKRLSQLLRLNHTAFLNIVQANVGDGMIIMNNLLQHWKEQRDPLMEGILTDTEKMLARGRMDLPLGLCFAATRDLEGSVPLWDAILGRHKNVIKLLVDNGATISSGDVGQFACTAVEQNNLELLKDLVHYGGDVMLSKSSGMTALQTAISEGNIEIVKFLLDQGVDIDKPGEKDPISSASYFASSQSSGNYPARVTLSCPEKGEVAGKLVLLPESLQELLDIGAKKFGFSPAKVLTKDGAEIEAIGVIRDGDHLLLVSNGGIENSKSEKARESEI